MERNLGQKSRFISIMKSRDFIMNVRDFQDDHWQSLIFWKNRIRGKGQPLTKSQYLF